MHYNSKVIWWCQSGLSHHPAFFIHQRKERKMPECDTALNKETSNTEEMRFPLDALINQQRANWRGRCFLVNRIDQQGHNQRFIQENGDWLDLKVCIFVFFLSFYSFEITWKSSIPSHLSRQVFNESNLCLGSFFFPAVFGDREMYV